MLSRCVLQGWILGVACCAGAGAQGIATSRWTAAADGYYGLQAGRSDFTLNIKAGPLEPTALDRVLGRSRPQGLSVSILGNRGWSSDFGVHGRLGTVSGRGAGPLAAARLGSPDSGLSYGVGLSWDFSPHGSAVLGWDSYDFRSARGEREVRATSLGLQWRY